MAFDSVVGSLRAILGLDASEFERGASKAQRDLDKLGRRFEAFGRRMTTFGKGLSLAFTAPLAAIGVKSIANWNAQEKAIAAVEAALRSTGGAAGFSSKRLQDMASSLQALTVFGDEEILDKVTANLLTFTNISGAVFERAQMAVLDLSTRLGQDLQSSAIQVGKALNDPVRGLTALQRVGIVFSKGQQKVIKDLATTGHVAKAQAIILNELNREFGGQAAAYAKTAAGQVKQAQNAVGDLLEEFGKLVAVVSGPVSGTIREFVNWISGLSAETKKWIGIVALGTAALGPLLIGFGSLVSIIGGVVGALRGLAAVLTAAIIPTLGPAGWLVAGLVAVAAGVSFFIGRTNQAKTSTEYLKDAVDRLNKKLSEQKKGATLTAGEMRKLALANLDAAKTALAAAKAQLAALEVSETGKALVESEKQGKATAGLMDRPLKERFAVAAELKKRRDLVAQGLADLQAAHLQLMDLDDKVRGRLQGDGVTSSDSSPPVGGDVGADDGKAKVDRLKEYIESLRQAAEAERLDAQARELNAAMLQAENLAREQGRQLTDNERRQIELAIEARQISAERTAQQNELDERRRAILEGLETPLDRYNQGLAETNDLLARGLLTTDQAIARQRQLGAELEQATDGPLQDLKQVYTDAGRDLAGAITSGLRGEESDWAGILKRLGDRLLELVVQIHLVEPLLKSLGLGGGGATGGGILGGLGGLFGLGGGASGWTSGANTWGMTGSASSSGGLFSQMGSFFGSLGFFADGGRYAGRQWMMVGEEGPELLRPDSAGRVIPNDMLGDIGGGGVTFAPVTHLTVGAGVSQAQVQAALDQRDRQIRDSLRRGWGSEADLYQRYRG